MRFNFTKIFGGNIGEVREITSKETHGGARMKIWGRFMWIWMGGGETGERERERELGRRLRKERNEQGRAGNGWALGIITLGSAPKRTAPT
jgi:hypothetical protein